MIKNIEIMNDYCAAAEVYGQNLLTGDDKIAEAAFTQLTNILKSLHEAGLSSELFELYEHHNKIIQLAAAAHTLEIDEGRAKNKLRILSRETGHIGFSAEITLKEWSKGKLKFR